MTEMLPGVEGAEANRELSQWYTPPELALRVAQWACQHEKPKWVLEPAAGRGALVSALETSPCAISAWDIDPDNCAALRVLRRRTRGFLAVICGDFLGHDYPPHNFDMALMNPPYEGNQDIAFVDRALDCSDRVVGIFQSRILHSKGRAPFWRHVDIQRLAILSERPDFGGEHSAKTDFVVMELFRRGAARRQGEATAALVEWWETCR